MEDAPLVLNDEFDASNRKADAKNSQGVSLKRSASREIIRYHHGIPGAMAFIDLQDSFRKSLALFRSKSTTSEQQKSESYLVHGPFAPRAAPLQRPLQSKWKNFLTITILLKTKEGHKD